MMKPASKSPFVPSRMMCVGLFLGAALSLQAHPGHGLTDQGALHMVSSPLHLATLAFAGSALLAGGALVRQASTRRVLQGVGIACLALTVVLGLRA